MTQQRHTPDTPNVMVMSWSGRTASLLQSALRMTHEQFAAKLGVSVRTVSRWHEQPDMTPRTEMQDALDTLLDRCSDSARARFGELHGNGAEQFRAAIAVVIHSGAVLLVCRHGDTPAWQFPAGTIKPGGSAESVVVSETLAETGIHVAPRKQLGQRLHPITKVLCEYWACDYLAGEPSNRDPLENADVIWCPLDRATKLIPPDRIYPPILNLLEVPA